MSPADRLVVDRLARSSTSSHRVVTQAKAPHVVGEGRITSVVVVAVGVVSCVEVDVELDEFDSAV